ncbi:hypothetical protein A1O1_05451 [Capronia coronata CBS 617.96]|uniref:Uncharacterized protein n=1 Tax=Capronia coronata CBS 617.96 TaxID=1182541 RepID=W9YGY4_9EURO|nr:uncharacterized protein A1O1_05451 [Capronia coronata CBS 617.96]EXJ88521.1 hypothetical protein A1O1_05451 [Capronia coronata CBS 617.96]
MLPESVAGKAQSVLDFAAHLKECLSKDAETAFQGFPDVLFYIRALPLPRKEISPSQRLEFDREGVAIWNSCCKLVTKRGTAQHLGDLADDSCRLETGVKIVEQLASKQESLSRSIHDDVPNSSHVHDDLKEQYLLLRVALVRKRIMYTASGMALTADRPGSKIASTWPSISMRYLNHCSPS